MNMTAISDLIPHAGNMVLIKTVQSCDQDDIICTTDTHFSPTNPLRNAHGLPISAALEYGAQAIALHGAMNKSQSEKSPKALIVAVRQADWTTDWLHTIDSELIIQASIATRMNALARYTFKISSKSDNSYIYQADVSVSIS